MAARAGALLASLLLGAGTAAHALDNADLGQLLKEGRAQSGWNASAAVATLKSGLRHAEMQLAPGYQADFSIALAYCLSGAYDFKEAQRHAQRALAIARNLGSLEKEAMSLMELCTADAHLGGDSRKAAKQCMDAYDIFRKLGEDENASVALSRLALVQTDLGAYRAALNTLAPLLQRDVGRSPVHWRYIGRVFLLLGQYQQAASYLEKYIFNGELPGECQIFVDLGHAELGLRRKKDAAQYFNIALEQRCVNPYSQDAARMSLGRMFLADNDKRGHEIMAAVRTPLHRGRLELLKKRFAASQRLFKEAAKDAVTVSDAIAAHAGLGQAAEGLGDKTAARQAFATACGKIEAIRERLPAEYQDSYMAGEDSGFTRSEVCAAYRRY